MLIRQEKPFPAGCTAITSMEKDDCGTLMDFEVLKLDQNQTHTESEKLEKAYLLLHGEVLFQWEEKTVSAGRKSLYLENPVCLHVSEGVSVQITARSADVELVVVRTENPKQFPSVFYGQDNCMTVEGGKGQLDETSLRTIRTIFDLSNAPEANLVLGEVVHHPGRWSSYPPHHHPQPELYFYRFQPEQGFGYSEIGENVYKVRNNDAAVIPGGVTHPQVAAPGYQMYYVWAIRHLENNPFNDRIYAEEHRWLVGR